jgi:hypothetical protein
VTVRAVRSAVAATLIFVAAAADLRAQGVQFSLGGGVGIPLGTYDDVVKTGWHGSAGLFFAPTGVPIGFQVDGSLAQFSDETPLDITSQLMYGTANAVYKFASAPTTRFRPYVLGGLGVYNSKAIGDDAPEGSTTKAGINLGAGLDVRAGGVGLFAETRWHNVFLEGDNLKFLPIAVGVRIGGR